MIFENEKAPPFFLSNQMGVLVERPQEGWLVLFFYPKDNTPGCTQEALDFERFYPEFLKLNTHIMGVSPDSVESHKKFHITCALSYPLLSDPDKTLTHAFGVWREKKNYGRLYWGIERSTFLISPDGIIQKIWRGVKVGGHVETVLAARAHFAS